ncbi:C2 calcium/lipid-binding plantphosphoribosyltransferase family protein [Striga asiatica]|uniref:C2 calcium/lipid-binding plantphosphoribosyltransferase family protein n=1 Tax=Striga asiatica TaxID=4170 RepID=A0A5A7PIN0_STRAF|nr:C2 calcium/lipid-binding plantphosphoribosyltransferase family protein [Striga asiatica]
MAETCSRKLTVEVCNAKNLMPKDGQGTASAYAIVDFDGQRRRTRTILRDLNPQWDEKLEFSVLDSAAMADEMLELNLYNDKKTGKRSTFLGKVKISGSTFVKSGDDVPLVYYPLEKRSVFSQIKGEIGLKVWYTDEEPPPAPAPEKNDAPTPPASEEKPPEEEKVEEKKSDPEAKENEKKEAEPKSAQEESKEEEKPPETTAPPVPPSPKPAAPTESEHPPISQQTAAPIPKKSIVTESSKSTAEIESQIFRKITGGAADRRTAFDLVDQMPFLFVRVVKAKISNPDLAEPTFCAKLIIGTHSIKTRSQPANSEWDQVFAFDKEGLNSSSLEISIIAEKKIPEKETTEETSFGTVSFDLQEVPKRVPPDSPLAPQWYSLEGEGSPGNDVMLSVWVGTQADEAFQEAWQSDSGGLIPETRAKVYLSPKLWYLRLTVIQTQDLQLVLGPEPRSPRNLLELYVKAQLGPQVFKTSRTCIGSTNPTWNEDLIFVAAEPFEPFLTITVEDASSTRPMGHARVQIATVDRRTDDKSEPRSTWYNLTGDDDKAYAGRIHVRACLEGGYHVLDEAAHVTSDVRPTAKHLSKPPIGLLEVGIRGASNLLPVKTADGTRGTTDAYVVAKYGPKWVRTRTILDRFNPRWNEQYTFDVYDPCTVLTVGVFDNGSYNGKKDVCLGKLRVRLSTLDTNRVYAGTYSLTTLLPGGARRMGEVEIALRFSCSSWIGLVQAYASPTLPRMHYVKPMGPAQQDVLRHNAMRIVTARLARSEPALGHEVVQYMLDTDTHVWSMRRSKANWFRVVGCLSRVAAVARWVDGIRTWAHPPTTVLVHVLLTAVVLFPDLFLPAAFLYAFLILALRFRCRRPAPVAMDPGLSCVDAVGPDELDEEFDGFPSARPAEQVRVRYDRLRALAGRAQTLLGDVAAQGERVEALFSWRDPRATGIFLVVCLVAAIVFYVVPLKAFVLGSGVYYLRHPRFRGDMPSVPMNFFRRLPPQSDRIL